ncbi:MAG TPA: hypothetical protein V6D05_18850 [Stenomitos sp.]
MEVVRFEYHPELLERFIDVPCRLYRKDRHWIPPFRDSVRAQLGPEAPFRQHGRMVHFLAVEGTEAVGRCSAILNRRYEEDGEPIGFIGYFEGPDRYEVTEALLSEAVAWLKAQGVETIRGPLNTSTYHPYRFMTRGYEHGSFFLEPYNPPHYPEHWERFGFKPCRQYASMIVDSKECADLLQRDYDRTIAAGLRFRTFDRSRFDDELRLMYDLSTRIFSGSWMWRPISFPEFRDLYAAMRSIMDPELCYFLFQDEEPVGFVFGLPDFGAALRAMGGKSDLWAKLRFLSKRGQAKQALLKTFGVVPGRRTGTYALALCHVFHRAATERGYAQTVHALMRDDNVSLKMSLKRGGEPYKQYALYQLGN